MSRLDLSRRDIALTELMDDPDCDRAALDRTYAGFAPVNRLVAGWRTVYRRHLAPLLSPDRLTTLLDVGSGAGDVPRILARWAARDGRRLVITAVDPDPRAHAYASARPPTPGVTFRQASSRTLVDEGARFDVVTSNHLLHHLDVAQLDALLDDSVRLARRLVLHNDLARSGAAYLGWSVASRAFAHRSFIRVDGLRSIRRSYRPAELATQVEPGWQVLPQFPARLLLTRSQAVDGDTEGGTDVAHRDVG